MSKLMIELADLENIIDTLQHARNPLVKFSLDPEEMTTRAIVLMQDAMDQATRSLRRICKEANDHGS